MTRMRLDSPTRYELLKTESPNHKKAEELVAKLPTMWPQLALIISSLATAAIFSSVGLLPAAVLTTMKITALSTTGFTFLLLSKSLLCGTSKSCKEPEKIDEPSENAVKPINLIDFCIKGPIVEEILFRGLLQGGLDFGLNRLFTPLSISFFGLPVTAASVAAGVIAGLTFGLVHLSNDGDPRFQTVKASITGVFLYGRLFHLYGLWSTCLAHIINNTMAITPLVCALSLAKAELNKKAG